MDDINDARGNSRPVANGRSTAPITPVAREPVRGNGGQRPQEPGKPSIWLKISIVGLLVAIFAVVSSKVNITGLTITVAEIVTVAVVLYAILARGKKISESDKSFSLIDLQWITPIVSLFVVAWLLWRLPGLQIVAIFMIILVIAILFVSSEQKLFMSCPQNSGVGIMWGTGKTPNLHKFVVSQGKNNYAVNADGEIIQSFWFEKVFNIWWMGIHGSVHKYHTTEIDQSSQEVVTDGENIIGKIKKTVRVLKSFIEINREVVLPLIIPPLICKDKFAVTIDAVAYYTIKTVKDALKALFNVGNLSLALSTKFGIALKEQTANMTFDELQEQQESIKAVAWQKMKAAGDFDIILRDWGTTVNDIGISDVNPVKAVADAMQGVFIKKQDADAKIEEGRGVEAFRTAEGRGEGSYNASIGEGFAKGFKAISGVPGGIEMYKAKQMAETPGVKILSSDIFGVSSGGKNQHKLRGDLLASKIAHDQLRDEPVRDNQNTERQSVTDGEKTEPRKSGNNKRNRRRQ